MRCHLGLQEGTHDVVAQAKLNSWHMTWDKTSWQCQLRSKMGVKWLERTLINNFHLHFGLLCIQRLWYFSWSACIQAVFVVCPKTNGNGQPSCSCCIQFRICVSLDQVALSNKWPTSRGTRLQEIS
jgi:hypothetical protein